MEPHDERPPIGAFRISPDLARSLGLPLPDRLALYRMLGFRTVSQPREVTVEEEPLLWWRWRGRDRAVPRPPPPSKRGQRHMGAAAAIGGGKPALRGERKPARASRPEPRPAAPRPAPAPVNNPFAALADLLGKSKPG